MADTPSPPAGTAPSPEAGIIQRFDPAKRIGVVVRADGSTLLIPPFGLAEGEGPLAAGQPVTFSIRMQDKGPVATEVRAAGAAPPSDDEVTQEVAASLGETAAPALAQIRRIVRTLGRDATWGFVVEARRVEAAGGMLVPDGSRRRTLGGVFFVLVRAILSEEDREHIFPSLTVRYQRRRERKARARATEQPAEPAPPPLPPLLWDDRIALIEHLRQESGKATTVKMTVIGRPSQIEQREQVTLLTLTHSGPLPALPKGIPAPNPMPATTYSVYIGKKQWKAVAEAIQNPDDVLIVEGTPMLDATTGTIAVFATKTTTRLLQQAAKQPRPAEQG